MVPDSDPGMSRFYDVKSLYNIQVTPPYLCAGLGMVGAGLVLDAVQYWPVFRRLPELFIMVPALIGLKGNLEMTLASRRAV